MIDIEKYTEEAVKEEVLAVAQAEMTHLGEKLNFFKSAEEAALASEAANKDDIVKQLHDVRIKYGETRSALAQFITAIAVIALFIAVQGCGAGALGAQADVIGTAGILSADADIVLIQARAHDLDAIVEDARAQCGDDGCTEEQSTTIRARMAATEAHWAPVLACYPPIPIALKAWIDGVETANETSGDIGATLVLRLSTRFVAEYRAMGSCVMALDPSVTMPALPALLLGGGR